MNSRNITLTNTFEEFARQTEDIDLKVEDLMSYCLENTNVFYYLNIESIWGPVGFEWDVYENKGHFNVNPVKVTVLPKVPDPERLKNFEGLFTNLRSIPKIEIIHNTWNNMDTLGNWNHPYVTIHVDEDHKFTKICTSFNKYFGLGDDCIKLIGGDYSNLTELGDRYFVYAGVPMNIPLLGSLDASSDSMNGYKFVKVKLEERGMEVKASDFINTDEDNWEIHIPVENGLYSYIPSAYVDGNKININTDLRPVSFGDTRLWHTLLTFRNTSVSSINVINAHEVDNTEDMYMLLNDSSVTYLENFTAEGNEINMPVVYSNTSITQEQLESLPDKYNLFANPNHKCRFWSNTVGNTISYSNNFRTDRLSLKLGKWLYSTTITDLKGPLSFTVDASLTKDFTGDQFKYVKLDNTLAPTLNMSSYGVPTLNKFIADVKNNAVIKLAFQRATGTQVFSPMNIVVSDINYIQSDNDKASIIEGTFSLSGGDRYIMFLNDSLDKLNNLTVSTSIILTRDITICGTLWLTLWGGETSPKITVPEGKGIEIRNIIFDKGVENSKNILPHFINIHQLRTPINDPDNYEYNHDIVQRFKIPIISRPFFSNYSNGGIEVENRQPYFVDSNIMEAYQCCYMMNRTTEPYSSDWKKTMGGQHAVVLLRNQDLLAVDYPKKISFALCPWFIDENADFKTYPEAATTLLKSKVDEFYSKILLNPANKGKSNLSVIQLTSEQYALFDREQINTLIEYGYAFEEVVRS